VQTLTVRVDRVKLGPLNARHVRPDTPHGPPVLLLHGIGLGAWVWERDQRQLAELGLESFAVDLPGHGDGRRVGLSECYDAVADAARVLGEPALVGHSAGGLVAQVVASRQPAHSVVLVGSVPCSPVPFLPTRSGMRSFLGRIPQLMTGRALTPGKQDYVRAGMSLLAPEEVERAVAQLNPWPHRMAVDLVLRRPRVESLACPVLVTHGLQDPVTPLRGSRLLADHFDAPLWRFDDLAHLPSLEPGGERHLAAVAEWLAAPHGRRIHEIDPLAPHQGVGEQTRTGRRGFNRPRSDSRFGDRRRK
jgi:pimeloyl-ACP methyl ester carboxylesterase